MSILENLQRRLIDAGLLPKFLAALPKLSMLLVSVSVMLMLYLPMDGQFRRTYISENALMPSQAYSYFRETEWNILRGYRKEIEVLSSHSSIERNAIMSSWLEEFGLKTSVYKNQEYGDSLYGVFNAPRGDGTESMVLAVPWYNAEDEFNVSGAALGVSLARFLSRWPVWSKNIIVVFSENPREALRSWVEAYHTSLDLTGGSIEAAVVLDYPGVSDYFEYIEVHYNGYNGVLPNLDLVNIAISIAEHEGLKVSLHGLTPDEMGNGDYWSRLKMISLGTKNLALTGVREVYGNEAFSGWRIQALTLKARGDTNHDVTTFGRVAEAMFRSINNLLEKFHQSFFFYFLLAPRYFVSIGSYLPAAVVLSISFAVASIDSFVNNQYVSMVDSSYYNLLSFIFWAVSVIVCFFLGNSFTYYPQPLLLLLGNVVISTIPLAAPKNLSISEPLAYRLKTISFMYLSLVMTSLLVVNFPLAFGMGLFAYPMTLVMLNNTDNLRLKTRNSILLAISNPFIAFWLFITIVESKLDGIEAIYGLVDAWNKLGSWTWFIFCIGWFPSWILVAISALKVEQVQTEPNSKKHL
ncbi:hypothetical protein Kpol_543p37 [Vanderwaltozyma polyspora DSM 70294]|uniref:GPI transamidase component GAA1 n=1 Tax=Vanderwaltozyma polyspora (strain ATCC 22028 / DSM 70294 / BCRC 21397 / CBS 2163 / NBRC 10782 / NRRL Y-8283 / UCD 57-17) TaxID=436907 RepID=A7THP1_VANPO|nr:uncharacterized protein Kpol_543p37 [Vanderwaltozyma polyspora DSM 70294]EDO18207.1 hypothetical protein Kpol_543p37 [Vanderwaltozyma polyspora DSM 70294]